MKTQLSSLELHYLVKELQYLVNGRIDQIYQPSKKELILQFHIPQVGKKILKLMVPNLLYVAGTKEFTENPPGFCMLLRKYIANARLRQFRQLESERIVELMFETKQARFRLIIELFSKGNIIFTKEDYTIINPLEQQSWKDREVKKGVKYKHPKKDYDLFSIKKDELKKLINESTRDSIVKTLAVNLGLGGIYAEELLIQSKIDKAKSRLDDDEISLLFGNITKLINRKIEPFIIRKDKDIVDIVPFDLIYYKSYDKEPKKSYSEAFDVLSSLKLDEATIRYNKKLETLKLIIADQEATIKRLDNEREVNNKKGEQIYEKYQLIDNILKELKKAREKLSWKDIKERLKNHKVIKDINEKENKITIDV